MRISPGILPPPRLPEGQPQHTPIQHTPMRMGHAHFWQRALSRRQVISAGAGGAAAMTLLGSRLWLPQMAHAAAPIPADPTPIPLTLGPFHVQLLGPGQEPSTITDFNGFVGVADVQGTGTGTGPGAGSLLFDTDMRFMNGEYVGVDGKHYHGTFGFV
jgi:hypothetical protein